MQETATALGLAPSRMSFTATISLVRAYAPLLAAALALYPLALYMVDFATLFVQESQDNNQVNQISYWISAAYWTGLAVAIVSLGFLPCTRLAALVVSVG